MVVTEYKFVLVTEGGCTDFYLKDAVQGNPSFTSEIKYACKFNLRTQAVNEANKIYANGVKNKLIPKPLTITYELG